MNPTTHPAHTATATNFDLPSLHILLNEIKVVLKDAELHLGEFYDDEEQSPLLMDSATTMNQLANIFRLINFKGADALVVALVDCLTKLHDEGHVNNNLITDISYGIMVLDRYIEFVLLKERLDPELIVATINKLRHHLGQTPITSNDLMQGNSVSINNPRRYYQNLSTLNLDTKALITAYRAGLEVLLSHKSGVLDASDQEKFAAMRAACATIAEQLDSLFWQAAKTITEQLTLPLNNHKKRVLIYIEQQLQHYLPLEDRRFADLISLASHYDGNFLPMAAKKYGFGHIDSQEQTAMQHFLFGPNRQITDTINHLIQEDIKTIKINIDAFVRGDSGQTITAAQIAEHIHQLSQAMQLLDLQDASDALKKASNMIRHWQTPTAEDFDSLLNELIIAENAAIFLAKSHTPGVIKLPLHNRHMSLYQLDNAYTLLSQESRATISSIIGAIDGYLSDKKQDLLHLQNVPDMLKKLSGAAIFLNFPKTAVMMKKLSKYLSELLVEERPLSDKQLAEIADVVAVADYQFEGYEQNRLVNKNVLLFGQHSLNQLLMAA